MRQDTHTVLVTSILLPNPNFLRIVETSAACKKITLTLPTPGIRPNASGAATVSPDGKQD